MWITQPEAAEILGVHPQTVAKMVARGELTSRGQGVRGSLDRDEVRALGVARRDAADWREAERVALRRRVRTGEPPDAGHESLRLGEAAAFMDVTEPAISQHARKGRLPFVEHEARRWFRRDHLELVKHADLVKSPNPGTRSMP